MKDFIILFLVVFSSLSIYLLGKIQDRLHLSQIIVYLQSTAIKRFLDYKFAAFNFDKERLKGIRQTLKENDYCQDSY